jgi:hypothetical protein
MCLTQVLSAAVILSISAPAVAQEWVEFISQQDRFTCVFPVQPKVTNIAYKSQFGADLPARVYSADSGASRYVVTVVDYSNIESILTEKSKSCPAGAQTCKGGANPASSTGAGYWRADVSGAVIYATWQLLQRDAKPTYLGWNNVDLVEGQMLYLVNADKSRTSAAIYMHENRLYILEGTVPPGYPEPGFFQQSVGWLDENGKGIRYQSLYHQGFPKPPLVNRGGQGQSQPGGAGNTGQGGQPR